MAPHVAERLVEHLRALLVGGGRHQVQAHQRLADLHRHVPRAGHAGPPGPRAVAQLQRLQLADGRCDALLQQVLVEEVGQSVLLLRLVLSVHDPRCLVEHQVLQLLVLLELRVERRQWRVLAAPLLEDGLCLRVLADDVAADGVGIKRCRLTDGAVVVGVANGRQRLDHEPDGVVGILDGEACRLRVGRLLAVGLGEERCEVDFLGARRNLREGHGDGDVLAVGQDGQVVLLAVTEVSSADGDLCNEQGGPAAQRVAAEADADGRVGSHGDGLCALCHGLLRLGVDEEQAGGARQLAVAHVGYASRDGGLVALTQESRHVRLNHHVLAGHGLVAERAVHHVARVGHGHESPGGEALGQREAQGHLAVGIGGQLGVEEGRLLQVLAHLYGLLLGGGGAAVVVGSGFLVGRHDALLGLHGGRGHGVHHDSRFFGLNDFTGRAVHGRLHHARAAHTDAAAQGCTHHHRTGEDE